MIVTCCS